MIAWWWLLVEAAVFAGYAYMLRGWTWNAALSWALRNPNFAQQEIDALPIKYRMKLQSSSMARLTTKFRQLQKQRQKAR